MGYTEEQLRAYERGLQLSRAEHERPSTRRQLEAIADECRGSLPEGALFTPYMPAPDELIEQYATEDEQAAFYAGWLAGTGALPAELLAQLRAAPH
jgi:hypothetical protein